MISISSFFTPGMSATTWMASPRSRTSTRGCFKAGTCEGHRRSKLSSMLRRNVSSTRRISAKGSLFQLSFGVILFSSFFSSVIVRLDYVAHGDKAYARKKQSRRRNTLPYQSRNLFKNCSAHCAHLGGKRNCDDKNAWDLITAIASQVARKEVFFPSFDGSSGRS